MSFFIPSGPLRLEAVLREPRDERPQAAAVLCHPHPERGGTMDNRVIYRAGKAVVEAGLSALRFNFRGVGKSTGTYDEGVGEKDDVSAAIDWLQAKYPRLPIAIVGFSFGSWVGLEVGCRDPRIQALVGLGLPLNYYSYNFLIGNPKPALLIAGTHDQFCARERMDRLAERLPPSSEVQWLEGSGHFFIADLDKVQSLITGFLSARFHEQGNVLAVEHE